MALEYWRIHVERERGPTATAHTNCTPEKARAKGRLRMNCENGTKQNEMCSRYIALFLVRLPYESCFVQIHILFILFHISVGECVCVSVYIIHGGAQHQIGFPRNEI